MKYKGLIKKSRTYDLNAIIAVLGIVELNIGMLQSQLGDYYGLVFIGIAALGGYLRAKTTGSVGEKDVG